MIPGSRRNVFKDQSFGEREGDNTSTKADRWHAGGALHAKEKEGRGGGAHRDMCRVGERGDEGRLWVSAWCLTGLWSLEGVLSPCLVRPGRRLPVQGLSEGP